MLSGTKQVANGPGAGEAKSIWVQCLIKCIFFTTHFHSCFPLYSPHTTIEASIFVSRSFTSSLRGNKQVHFITESCSRWYPTTMERFKARRLMKQGKVPADEDNIKVIIDNLHVSLLYSFVPSCQSIMGQCLSAVGQGWGRCHGWGSSHLAKDNFQSILIAAEEWVCE